MKTARLVIAALLATMVLAACSGGGDDDGGGNGAAPDDDGGGGATSTELHVTAPPGAANDGFAETELSAPADTPFTIVFQNDDEAIPHNVQIFEGTSTTGTPVWAPADNAMITGPDEVTYEVPALPAGTYTFNCFSHPVTMVGTLTVA